MNEKFEGLIDHLVRGAIFLPDAVEILERGMIQRVIGDCRGNQSAASKQLGIHRNTLQRKMVEYGLTNGRARSRRKPVTPANRPRRRKPAVA